jgi:ABC-type sugar transport system substrate-binding protein
MFGNESVQIGQWIVKDSGGKANVIYVTIEDYPILEAGFGPLKSTVAKYCPDCSVEKFPITVDDLGKGAVPAKLVAYLQSHPETNYVDFSFADVMTGIPAVLKSAGLADKVKLVGQALGGSPIVLKGLKDKSVAAWVAQPNIYQTWLMVDAMARLSVGMELTEERAAAKQPTWVADSAAAVGSLNETSGWDGPPGYQEDFKRLWKS